MSNIIMDSYLEKIASEIAQAKRIGNDLKSFDKIGKEYYSFYNIKSDTILEWIDTKARELVANPPGWFSVVSIAYDLTEKHVFKVSDRDTDLIYVHKKRFKRFIKKALTRAATLK